VARTDLSRRGWTAARVPWRQQDQQPAPSGSVELAVSSKETSDLMHRMYIFFFVSYIFLGSIFGIQYDNFS
jgi:hypothetical protein